MQIFFGFMRLLGIAIGMVLVLQCELHYSALGAFTIGICAYIYGFRYASSVSAIEDYQNG